MIGVLGDMEGKQHGSVYLNCWTLTLSSDKLNVPLHCHMLSIVTLHLS